jgi:hypothetical protein
MLKSLESILGEDITRETTINNSNTTYDKNDYSSKNRTILTLTKYMRSP